MIFRNARVDEREAVHAIYESVKGGEFCIWDDTYPTYFEIDGDMAANTLYVLDNGERIAGVLSVLPENEMDCFDCWRVHDGRQREIGRIAVSPDCRGRGLAGKMVESICALLTERGVSAVHISAAKVNIPAQKTYKRLGFEIMGQTHMYGADYLLLEKKLNG